MKLEKIPINKLTHLNAELTKLCNLACGYCFNSSGLKSDSELSANRWKDILDLAKDSGIASVLFTGGEIMTRPDIAAIIYYSLDNNFKTSILSNGLNINANSAVDFKNLDRVQISLDSANKRFHDSKRGDGSWMVARSAIDYVRSLDVDVEISSVVSDESSLAQLDGLANIAYKTNSKLLLRSMQSIGRANNSKTYNPQLLLEQKKTSLENKFGNIFVNDFAHYVPVLGCSHDTKVLSDGYITILPDGKVRGVDLDFLEIRRIA